MIAQKDITRNLASQNSLSQLNAEVNKSAL